MQPLSVSTGRKSQVRSGLSLAIPSRSARLYFFGSALGISWSHPCSSFQIESVAIQTVAVRRCESHTSKVVLLKSSQSGTFTAFKHISIRIVQGLRGKAAPLKAVVAILLRCLIPAGNQTARVEQSSASTLGFQLNHPTDSTSRKKCEIYRCVKSCSQR